jgi:glycosyltransferase involved in cell wall biosynthesis
MADAPTLSVGLPVYNGAQFVSAALEAIQRQSYEDFELIVCDNASTDATEAICRAHAARDSRIRYHRNATNIGPAGNFNRAFELAQGRLFKWMAHDDLHLPDFLARCVAVVEEDPRVALAFTRAVTIDSGGAVIRQAWGAAPGLGSDRAADRFRAALEPPREPLPLPIFGVVRSQVLRATALQRALPGSDFALIAEIALHGRLVEIAEPLFLQREHPERAGHRLARDPYGAAAFWNGPGATSTPYPHWRLLRRHVDSIRRAHLRHAEARACRWAAWQWAWRERQSLWRDWLIARPDSSRVAPLARRLDQTLIQRQWRARTRRFHLLLRRAVPQDSTVLLADDGQLALDPLRLRIVPFVERNGTFWGPPADNAEAVAALERAVEAGASHFVVAWPAFWWLDYYREFFEHLRARAVCVADDDVAQAWLLTH